MIRGDRVRFLRKARKWTQNDLIDQVRAIVGPERFARNTLSEIENDSYASEPGVWLLDALAQVLDTSMDFLVGLTNEPGISIPKMPVPVPELAEMVARLNDLPAGVRQLVARIVDDVLRLYQERSVELETELFRRIVEAMPDEVQDEFQDRFEAAAQASGIAFPTPKRATPDDQSRAVG